MLLQFSTLAVGQPNRTDDFFVLRSAQDSYDRGNFQEAIASLNPYLKSHPGSFEADELMGLCLVANRQLQEGKLFLSKAVILRPDSSLGHANLAADLAELKEMNSAEIEFKKALALDPKSAELNHNLGELYAGLGKVGSAIPCLRKAQQLRPTYDNGYDLALAEMQGGELDAAERDIRELLRQRPAAELHSLLGTTLEKKGDFITAGNEMQIAAHLEPSEDNLFSWGAELLRHQTLKPAVEVFRNSVERFPRSARLQTGLGVADFLLNDDQGALTAFCAAIDLEPKDPGSYFLLSRVHRIPPEQQAEVTKLFEQHMAQSPKDAKARLYYATNLLDSAGGELKPKDLQKVKSLLEESIALDPRDAEAHLQFGIVLSNQQQNQAAAREFERCLALDPSANNARYRLAQTLIRLGEKERGRKEMQQWEALKSREDKEEEKREKEVIAFLYSKSD